MRAQVNVPDKHGTPVATKPATVTLAGKRNAENESNREPREQPEQDQLDLTLPGQNSGMEGGDTAML